jgi:hypothetical protein
VSMYMSVTLIVYYHDVGVSMCDCHFNSVLQRMLDAELSAIFAGSAVPCCGEVECCQHVMLLVQLALHCAQTHG